MGRTSATATVAKEFHTRYALIENSEPLCKCRCFGIIDVNASDLKALQARGGLFPSGCKLLARAAFGGHEFNGPHHRRLCDSQIKVVISDGCANVLRVLSASRLRFNALFRLRCLGCSLGVDSLSLMAAAASRFCLEKLSICIFLQFLISGFSFWRSCLADGVSPLTSVMDELFMSSPFTSTSFKFGIPSVMMPSDVASALPSGWS